MHKNTDCRKNESCTFICNLFLFIFTFVTRFNKGSSKINTFKKWELFSGNFHGSGFVGLKGEPTTDGAHRTERLRTSGWVCWILQTHSSICCEMQWSRNSAFDGFLCCFRVWKKSLVNFYFFIFCFQGIRLSCNYYLFIYQVILNNSSDFRNVVHGLYRGFSHSFSVQFLCLNIFVFFLYLFSRLTLRYESLKYKKKHLRI